MSYILDALRKSEQQRQATQPAAITDRLLVAPSQSKKESNNWLKTLLLLNLIFVFGFIWFFLYKPKPETHLTSTVNIKPESEKPEKLPAQKQDSPKNGAYRQPIQPQSNLPAISQLVESNKSSDPQSYRPGAAKKQTLDRKNINTKKKTLTQETLSQKIPNNSPSEAYLEQPVPANHNPVNVKELPYRERNNLPAMNINVFSYAQRPEDRFVIIDMVKYKPGQFIKDSVRLKEIREDGIVVDDGGKTFKIERP